MSFNTIIATKCGDVIRITLNRLGKKNSLNAELLSELNEVLDFAEEDQESKIIILEGQNGIFCTGMDFEEAVNPNRTAGTNSEKPIAESYIATLRRFSTIPRVVIAKVDGQVMAGGVGLVAASDLVIATGRSRFSLSETLWGLLPCMVIPYLIRRVGFQKAYSLTMTTLALTAAEAEKINLIDELSDDPDVSIEKYCQRLRKLGTETIWNVKQYFRNMWILNEDMERQAVEKITELMSQEHVKRNIRNFVESRKFPWD